MSGRQLTFILSLSVIVFVFAWGRSIYSVYENSLNRQPATPEQLTVIAQETPCAAEEFKKALQPDTYGFQPGPLSFRNAKKLASDCREGDELREMRQVRANERDKMREEQLKALDGINK